MKPGLAMNQQLGFVFALAVGTAFAPPALAARVKDLVIVKGVRSNMLEGIGLVVGLAGTGDSPRSVASQAVQSYLRKRGLNIPATDLRMRNVAFVTVVASLPPYAAQGARIDVKVMASGDARSLRGGTLLITPLVALNGAVYAVAQGSVTRGRLFGERRWTGQHSAQHAHRGSDRPTGPWSKKK